VELANAAAVVDVTGLAIDDLAGCAARAATQAFRPLRDGRHALLVHFALARRIDVRELARRQLTQRGGCSAHCGRREGAWSRARRARRPERAAPAWITAETPAGEAEPAIDALLEEVG